MKKQVLLAAVLASTLGFAQTISQSEGDIPNDFSHKERERQLNEFGQVQSWNSSSDEVAEDRFLQAAQFNLNEMMVNGRVLFGDPMTNYLNDIVGNLVEGNRELNTNIKVYTYRSSVPNAFMTINGNLFVTTGLLAQVQNETEIALIMAHEIGHHANDDLKRGFQNELNTSKIATSQDFFNSTTYDYSRELELEADLYGLNLLVESGVYNPEEALSLFDVLLFAYLPYDEIPFDFNMLLPEGINAPDDFIIRKANPITAFEDYDDSESTHPNIKARKGEYVEALLEMESPGELPINPLGDARFNEIQKIARENVLRQDLMHRNYIRAIYNGFLMTRHDSTPNESISASIGFALHALSRYKKEEMYSDVVMKTSDVEGQLHPVHHFFEKCDDVDLAALALAYNYKLHLAYPENAFIEQNYKNSLDEIVWEYEWPLSDFTHDPAEAEATMDTLTEEEVNALSKIDKIKYQRALNGEVEGTTWTRSVLFAYKDNQDLIKDFEEAEEAAEEGREMKKVQWSNFDDIDDLMDQEEYDLDLDEVIYLSPLAIDIDGFNSRTENLRLDYAGTYELRRLMSESTLQVINATRFRGNYLAPEEFKRNDVQDYNDYALLRAYIEELSDHGDMNIGSSLHAEMVDLADRYGTQYVVLPRIFRLYAPGHGSLTGLIFCAAIPPLWYFLPETAGNMAGGDHLFYSNMVIDIVNNELLMLNMETYNTSGSKTDYRNAIIYESIQQISK